MSKVHRLLGTLCLMALSASGTYRLTMQFADGYHASYGKEMSASIKVTVKWQ